MLLQLEERHKKIIQQILSKYPYRGLKGERENYPI
jgi:hypothetical protein